MTLRSANGRWDFFADVFRQLQRLCFYFRLRDALGAGRFVVGRLVVIENQFISFANAVSGTHLLLEITFGRRCAILETSTFC